MPWMATCQKKEVVDPMESSVTTFCRCVSLAFQTESLLFVSMLFPEVFRGQQFNTWLRGSRGGPATPRDYYGKSVVSSDASPPPISSTPCMRYDTQQVTQSQSLRAAAPRAYTPAKRQLAAPNRAPLFFAGETMTSSLK
jgi:hypothetical protein